MPKRRRASTARSKSKKPAAKASARRKGARAPKAKSAPKRKAAAKRSAAPARRPRAAARPAAPAPAAAHAEPRVLVADDDPDIRSIVAGKLSQMSCKVLVAQSGDEALARAVVERPDIILLDVMMPGLNGWEVARELRRRPDFDSVGLIMLTGVGETVNAATAPLYGADDRIDKPFQLSELEFKVRKVLAEKRRRA